MEGPTPVSALIHAATMVTAGVYLIARMHPLFEQAPARRGRRRRSSAASRCSSPATIALVQTDLKRVIAYSTMSQIGYMIMGVSAGAYVAGIFHLMTHAFFKALLFMAAGSVIGAMGGDPVARQDGRASARRCRSRSRCFVIGGLALVRRPAVLGLLLQGRDPRLRAGSAAAGTSILAVVGYLGAFLTGSTRSG